ncbi:MAG: hypothetical protein Fur0018_02630 [Anaerolineales bacterium]
MILERRTPGIEPPLRYDLLQMVLRQTGPFPHDTVVFGVGENGYPVILELNQPRAGALCVVADAHCGQYNLLRTVLYSLTRLNQPENVCFYAISAEDSWLYPLTQTPHCLGVEAPYRRSVDDLLLHLVDVVEARRAGRRPGPNVLVVLDNLGEILSHLEAEFQRDVHFLLCEGPAQGIWPLVYVASADGLRLWREWVVLMGTHVCGYLQDPHLAMRLSLDDTPRATALRPGREFGVFTGGRWLRFAIPAFFDDEISFW